MKKLQQILFLILVLNLMHITTYAQLDDPGGEPDVPIDGGLSLLVAAGVGYGAKQLRKKRNATLDVDKEK